LLVSAGDVFITGMAPNGPAKNSGEVRRGDQLLQVSGSTRATLHALSDFTSAPQARGPQRAPDATLPRARGQVDGKDISSWDVKDIVALILGRVTRRVPFPVLTGHAASLPPY
jgi:hypothetical protein